MKAVLLSIKPKWCDAIAAGEKTIEVRKTCPKIRTPFRCYIYETNNTKGVQGFSVLGRYRVGKVIGEFVCDKISEIGNYEEVDHMLMPWVKDWETTKKLCENACMRDSDISEYLGEKKGYGWHISDLKIYDKPRELSVFYTIDESGNDCCIACVYHETPLEEMPCRTCTGERRYLYRPPQSWQYVEELEK